MTTSLQHAPVLLEEALAALQVRAGGTYVDCTFGRGGHSRAILGRLGEQGRLIALDRDPEAVAAAEDIADARFVIVHAPFSELREVLGRLAVETVHGVLLDLGVSSTQIDDPQRIPIVRLEGMDQAGYTLTDLLLQPGFRNLMRDNLPAPPFECPLSRSAIPVMIDDCVAEHPVKPGDDTFFIAQFGPALQGAQERGLKNVLRDRPGFHAGFEESQELAVGIHQALDGRWRGSGRHEARLTCKAFVSAVGKDCNVLNRRTSASMKAHER